MGMVHAIKDGEAFGAYQQVALPTIEKFGGKPLFSARTSKLRTATGPRGASLWSSLKVANSSGSGTTRRSTKQWSVSVLTALTATQF